MKFQPRLSIKKGFLSSIQRYSLKHDQFVKLTSVILSRVPSFSIVREGTAYVINIPYVAAVILRLMSPHHHICSSCRVHPAYLIELDSCYYEFFVVQLVIRSTHGWGPLVQELSCYTYPLQFPKRLLNSKQACEQNVPDLFFLLYKRFYFIQKANKSLTL